MQSNVAAADAHSPTLPPAVAVRSTLLRVSVSHLISILSLSRGVETSQDSAFV